MNGHRLARCKYGLSAVLVVFGLETAAANEEMPSALSIDTELSNIARDTGLPGITFSVYGPHLRSSFAAGLADRETGARMLPDSVMMGASTGKMLVAVLAYQEVRLGRLHYSDKVFTYDVPLFQPTSNRRQTTGAVLELNGQLDALKLTSISSYSRAPTTQTVAISFTPPNVPGQSLYTTAGIRPTEVSTQEFRITSPSGGKFEWLVGLYGADIRNVLLNQNAVANYQPPPMPMVVNDFDTKRTDAAIFGTTSYHFGTLTLETGVRLTQTKYRADIFVEAGGLPNQSAEITSRAALPKISLSHALPNGGQVYATVAKGEEPGAVNTVSTAPIPYNSEKSTSYEIGAKSEAANRQFQYEVAVFYIKDVNHQFQTNQYIASEGGLVTLTAKIGDSRSYGVEASGTARSIDWPKRRLSQREMAGGNRIWTAHRRQYHSQLAGNVGRAQCSLRTGASKRNAARCQFRHGLYGCHVVGSSEHTRQQNVAVLDGKYEAGGGSGAGYMATGTSRIEYRRCQILDGILSELLSSRL